MVPRRTALLLVGLLVSYAAGAVIAPRGVTTQLQDVYHSSTNGQPRSFPPTPFTITPLPLPLLHRALAPHVHVWAGCGVDGVLQGDERGCPIVGKPGGRLVEVTPAPPPACCLHPHHRGGAVPLFLPLLVGKSGRTRGTRATTASRQPWDNSARQISSSTRFHGCGGSGLVPGVPFVLPLSQSQSKRQEVDACVVKGKERKKQPKETTEHAKCRRSCLSLVL